MSDTLGLDPVLLEILACPAPDHAPLRVDVARGALVCTSCHRAYPVREGIPVLLVEEALEEARDEARDGAPGGAAAPGA